MMSSKSFLCCFFLALSLTCTYTLPEDTIKTIQELRDLDFGHNYPRHGLNLLYWFSHDYITFDNNNNMQPAKDPQQGAFGFHFYANKEDLLPSLRNMKGYSYYVVGNLFDNNNLEENEKLPKDVMEEFVDSKRLDSKDQNNRDRIIVRRTPFKSVDEVYITQHYDFTSGKGSAYDPKNTYAVSTELLKDVRNMPRETFLKLFAVRNRNHYALCHADREGGPEKHPSTSWCIPKFSRGVVTSSWRPVMGLCLLALLLVSSC